VINATRFQNTLEEYCLKIYYEFPTKTGSAFKFDLIVQEFEFDQRSV